MNQDKPAIYALILCGGESRRMGSDKASLIYKGQSLLEHTKKIVSSAGIEKIFSVGKDNHDIQDPQAFQGPAFATVSALSTLKNAIDQSCSFIVLPVDMPLMSVDMLSTLVKTSASRNISCYFENHPFPFVLYQPFKHLLSIESMLSTGKSPSIRALLSTMNAQSIPMSIYSSASFLNVNTVEEWQRLPH